MHKYEINCTADKTVVLGQMDADANETRNTIVWRHIYIHSGVVEMSGSEPTCTVCVWVLVIADVMEDTCYTCVCHKRSCVNRAGSVSVTEVALKSRRRSRDVDSDAAKVDATSRAVDRRLRDAL